jgi:hypothetical protein
MSYKLDIMASCFATAIMGVDEIARDARESAVVFMSDGGENVSEGNRFNMRMGPCSSSAFQAPDTRRLSSFRPT